MEIGVILQQMNFVVMVKGENNELYKMFNRNETNNI